MPTAMQANDVLSVKAWSEIGGQAAVNTYNYQVISVVGGGCTDQDFANTIEASYGSFYTQLETVNSQYRGIQVYYLIRSGTLPFPVKSTASAGPGIQPQAPMPKVACPILKYNTVIRGPAGRGRVYLPFASSVFLDVLGSPTAALGVLVNSFASVLLTAVTVTSGANTATLVWILAHRPTPPGPVTVRGQIVAAESAQEIGQMHKRGDYGKTNASPI